MNNISSRKGEARMGLSRKVHNGEMKIARVNPTTEIARARSTEIRNTSPTLITAVTAKKNHLTERKRLPATTRESLRALRISVRNAGGKRTQVSSCAAFCSDCVTYAA